MHKLWLIARYEYLKRVAKRSFLVGTLGVPIFMVVIMAISVLAVFAGRNNLPLGYVDHSGAITRSRVPDPEDAEAFIEVRSFADEAAARTALEQGEISGFYVLPKGYPTDRTMSLYFWDDQPSESLQDDFETLLQVNLAADLAAPMQKRVLEGLSLSVRSADGQREFDIRAWPNLVIPFLAGFFFFFATMNGGSYMLQAVTDEKENRMMEVLSTSLRPEQLIGGKAVGLIAVSLTQVLIWVLTIVVGLVIAAPYFAPLRQIAIPWGLLAVVLLYFLPAYALIAGMMTAIGAAVTEMRQAQQIVGILNLLFIFPFFFISLLFVNPDSPILVALSLFPTTSFLTIIFRWGLGSIPVWQWIVSWSLLTLSAAGSIWIAARVFRIGMLRYGQRLTWQGVVDALRGMEKQNA